LTHQSIEFCRQVPAVLLEPQVHCGLDFYIQSESVVIYNVDRVRHMDVTWWKVQAVWGWSQQFLANGVWLLLDSVDHIEMDVIQYIYTLMSTSRFLMVQKS
jgi:hypothetical protein